MISDFKEDVNKQINEVRKPVQHQDKLCNSRKEKFKDVEILKKYRNVGNEKYNKLNKNLVEIFTNRLDQAKERISYIENVVK
jgi:hypothetical protein